MEEERKNLLVAGICLGDVTIALAALSDVLPSYAAGLNADELLGGFNDADEVRAEVEKEMPAKAEAGTLPPRIIRTILNRAIAAGKFLSAGRCLDLLGERDTYLERYLGEARKEVAEGMTAKAARALVVAANLDLDEGIPSFQYSGPGLHDTCTSSPQNCITRMERENAVLKSLKYLLPSERVHNAVSELPVEAREDLLGHVVLARDPRTREFIDAFEKAHLDMVDTDKHAIGELRSRVTGVEEEVRKFGDSLGRISAKNDEEKEAAERLRRTAAGLTKELTGLDDLVRERQFRRLTRRFEQLVESLEEIEEAARILGNRSGSPGAAFDAIIALIREVLDRDVLGQVKGIEDRLLSAQVTMLGRSVHSHEHWQYLRELAFKYPSSPLVCCVSRINDRWMVVPVWESPVAAILRASIGNHNRNGPSASAAGGRQET